MMQVIAAFSLHTLHRETASHDLARSGSQGREKRLVGIASIMKGRKRLAVDVHGNVFRCEPDLGG